MKKINEKYSIDENGRVWSKHKKGYLKPYTQDQRNYYVELSGKIFKMKDLMIQYFLPKPPNHKYLLKLGDPDDYSVSNLQWSKYIPFKEYGLLSKGEKIKRVPEYDYYYVTNFGRVFSVLGNVKELKPTSLPKTGHEYVTLCQDHQKKEYVHRLVAKAFLKKPENKDYVCHKDGNSQNNHLDNLYWGNQSENMYDRWRHDGGKTGGTD
jgi:hypothetical protein